MGTGKEEEQRKRKRNKKEMIGENNKKKQGQTGQLAKQPNKKHPTASVVKPGGEPSGAPASRQTERKKTKKTLSSKHIQHNHGHEWFKTTGRHSNCIASMRLGE